VVSEDLKTPPLSNCMYSQPETLSSSPLMPAKRLKITKTSSMALDNRPKAVHPKLELKKRLMKNTTRTFCKMTRWSPMEKYQFYKGLKAFGLDFEMTNKVLLPHRNKKDIFAYLRREDKRNSFRIDSALEWYRTNSNYKKESIQDDCSHNDLE